MNDGDGLQKKVWIEMLVGDSGTGFAQMDEAEEPATGGHVIAQ